MDGYPAPEDPGVLSVTRIYNYYKQHGYPTVVMGASFRNTGEILELAGCDLLTISPDLMRQLEDDDGDVIRKLDPAAGLGESRVDIDEAGFRWMLNEDAMATEKLADGIRSFTRDTEKLEALVSEISAPRRAAAG